MSEILQTVHALNYPNSAPDAATLNSLKNYFSPMFFGVIITIAKSIVKPVKNKTLFFLRNIVVTYVESMIEPVKNKKASSTCNPEQIPTEHFATHLNNPLRPLAYHLPVRQS